MKKNLIEYVVDNHLDANGTPLNKTGELWLKVALQSSENHIEKGYKSNEGRGRCVRKNGTFDYLKMSKLFHEGNW